MPKNIILLSDGTGNSAAKLFKTNVWRLYQALNVRPDSDQVAYYDDGVGTSSLRPLALVTGAFGIGLRRNVKDLYSFLCRNYEPGDQIFGFGFSRGAFTIRALVGIIASQGIVPGRHMSPDALRKAVDAAYARDQKQYRTVGRIALSELWRKILRRGPPGKSQLPQDNHRADVAFLGLWDTVDAYGLPIDELKHGFDRWVWPLSFPDRNLSPIVKRACHALSIDDQRRTFHPVLWNEACEEKWAQQNVVLPGRISQVWFAGMHANIGGGYAKDGLAHVSLNWMIQEAKKASLKFEKEEVDEYTRLADEHAEIGDSRAGFAAYYRYDPRRISALCNDDYHKVTIAQPKIHHTVRDRIEAQHAPYNPHVIPANYCEVDASGSVVGCREKVDDASWRQKDLERAWDIVWWRRISYFVTLGFTGLLVLFPWLWTEVKPCRPGMFCLLDPGLVAVAGLLPTWADFWVESFRRDITAFLVLAVGLVASMWFGRWLERRIAERAAEAWAPITGMTTTTSSVWGPLSWIARTIRTFEPAVLAYRWVARTALPFVFIVAAAAAVFVGVNRSLFEIAEATGWICKPTKNAEPVSEGETSIKQPFETYNPCFATGVKLERGRSYKISFDVTSQWIDGTHRTSPAGFTTGEGGGVFYIAAPARRSWHTNWFAPIARIDSEGRDRYDLTLRCVAKECPGGIGKFESRPFTARNDGELFLFVNDVVIAVPCYWSVFYNGKFDDRELGSDAKHVNNKGSATVTISRLKPAD